jgi:hypothetical protein
MDSPSRACAKLERSCTGPGGWHESGAATSCPTRCPEPEMPDWVLHEQSDAVRAPTLDEVRSLIAASQEFGARIHGFLAVVASTGMRRREACALRWDDIDFDGATVTIDERVSWRLTAVQRSRHQSRVRADGQWRSEADEAAQRGPRPRGGLPAPPGVRADLPPLAQPVRGHEGRRRQGGQEREPALPPIRTPRSLLQRVEPDIARLVRKALFHLRNWST